MQRCAVAAPASIICDIDVLCNRCLLQRLFQYSHVAIRSCSYEVQHALCTGAACLMHQHAMLMGTIVAYAYNRNSYVFDVHLSFILCQVLQVFWTLCLLVEGPGLLETVLAKVCCRRSFHLLKILLIQLYDACDWGLCLHCSWSWGHLIDTKNL